jgi:hypothetical protein
VRLVSIAFRFHQGEGLKFAFFTVRSSNQITATHLKVIYTARAHGQGKVFLNFTNKITLVVTKPFQNSFSSYDQFIGKQSTFIYK